jgi:arylsulfatase A-like enzyme
VVSNFVLRFGRGYERDFDTYDDAMAQVEGNRDLVERRGRDTTDRAIELLERAPRENVFLWVHYQDPHGPYTPPREYRDLFRHRAGSARGTRPDELSLNRVNSAWGGIPRYQRLGDHRSYDYYVSQYDAEIRFVDDEIGRLVHAIDRLGLYDDGLLVVTADHGEGMGEHDYYFGHGENLYDSLVRVPLLARFGDGAVGRRRDPVQHVDLLPTLLRRLDLPVDPRLRGRDLRATPLAPTEIFGAMMSVGARSDYESYLIHDGMKLIDQPPAPELERPRRRLYDLDADPGEERDLAGEPSRAPQLAALVSRLAALRADDRLGIDRSLFEGHRELTEEETAVLRSLGYVE